MKEKEKTFEKLDKKIKNKINSCSAAKSWSDLLPIMKDLHSILLKNNDYDFNDLSEKRLLAKRISQTLNPECPSGLHEVTLDVYEVILNNIVKIHDNKLMDNLYLYAYGLFPFFPNANLKNKIKILNSLITPIFLNLNKEEFKLSLPGLLSSLIPGLDDNNEQIAQIIYKIFDNIISKNNGEMERDFFGVYWMLLLRCQHLRVSGIKYLLEKITKYSDFIKLEEETKKERIEKIYPNINTTVVNSLCEIIKDKDIPTIRNGMDFILSRFPLTKENNIINDDAKINIIISGLHLLIANENSTVRRLKCWILGINNLDDDIAFDSEDMKYRMNLVIKAFKIIFNPEQNLNEKQLLDNIKIVERLFENQEEFINLILPDISYSILKCVVKYWEIELDYSELIEKKSIIYCIKKFFESKKECFDCLWKSLANSIKELSKEKDINSDEKINGVINPLKFSLIFFDMESNDERIKYYFLIVTNLLDIIQKFSTKRVDFKKIKQIILIILAFVKSLQEEKFHKKKEIIETIDEKDKLIEKKKQELNKINAEKNKNIIIYEIYDKIQDEKNKDDFILRPSVLNEINNDDNNSQYEDDNNNTDMYNICEISSYTHILKKKEFLELMKELNDNILKFQESYIKILTEYIKIKDQVTKFELFFFRQYAELIIRLQEYSQDEEDKIPNWVKYLEKIIFNIGNENNILSIEAANILLDINLSSSLKSKTFIKIKNHFKKDEIDKEIISESINENVKEKIKVEPNYFELLFGKFYLLSNKQINQTMIMELLFKMYIVDKEKFVKIINNSFESNEDSKENNIKLFNNFWKLANEYYPDEKFFENGECILNMVDLLSDNSPVLRHLSKTWLNQGNQYYGKIIDPILRILLDKQLIFEGNKERNSTQFVKEFDTSKIIDAFKKLKNIFLNCQIMPFLKEKKPDEELLYMLRFENFDKENLFYLQTLISICLHYTKTKSDEKLDETFKKNVLRVNAASCEFLEFLLNSVNDMNFLINNHKIIKESILKLLQSSLNNDDEIMPAQLLDTLKALYFSCPLDLIKKPENKTEYLKILNEGKLINTLIKGMTNTHFYIREHFLNFTLKCIETYISIITIEEKSELQNFYKLCNRFIQPLSTFLSKRVSINNQDKIDTEKYSHFDKNCNNLIYKNYCEEYKEYKTYEESDVLSILKSIKDIIKYCFKNEILEKSNKLDSKKNVKIFYVPIPFIKTKTLKKKFNYSGDWIAFKKDLVNGIKTNNPFLSFLNTVGIDITDKRANNEITDISSDLYTNQISTLLRSFLSIWINQSDKYELYDYCLNKNGILSPVKEGHKKIITDEQIAQVKESIKNNPIKQYILDIVMNLFITDAIKFMENIIGLWCLDSVEDTRDQNSLNDKQFKLSIIELLISMDIPIDIILFCIGVVLQNKIVIKKDIYKKTDKIYQTPYYTSINESKYFHFIYSYLLLNPIKYIDEKKNNNEILEIWKELTTIFNNSINGTKILYSFCWMYEILYLSSSKYNIKNLDNNIKMNIESVFSNLTYKLMDAIFFDKLDCKYLMRYPLVYPFLPHVYTNLVNYIYKGDNLYHKNLEGNNSKNNGNKNENNEKNNLALFLGETLTPDSLDENLFLKKASSTIVGSFKRKSLFNNNDKKDDDPTNEINNFYRKLKELINVETGKMKEIEQDKLNKIYQNLAFIVLKEDFYNLIKNLFNDNLSSSKKYYSDIMNKLLNLMKGKIKDQFKSQFANEFIAYLMENSPKNICSCSKGPLMEYIKSPQLFNVSQRELHERKIIISKLADEYQDILNDLIHEMNDNGIFGKKSEEEKRKILRRVSFVIYSCEKDKFSKDFGLIRDKAKELLTDYSNNNLLEGEIFLIMRMLFLRFSHEGVMQMIKDLWPIIFTELIQNIINAKNPKKNNENDFHVLLESFKFVELLSLVNIEEFSLYQWIFMLDTYDMNDLDTRNEESLLKKLIENKNNLFRPLSLEAFAENGINVTEKLLEGEHKGKSELYIQANNEETFKTKVKQFFYSIGDMNSYKVDANYEQIEENIENDFLDKENKGKNK